MGDHAGGSRVSRGEDGGGGHGPAAAVWFSHHAAPASAVGAVPSIGSSRSSSGRGEGKEEEEEAKEEGGGGGGGGGDLEAYLAAWGLLEAGGGGLLAPLRAAGITEGRQLALAFDGLTAAEMRAELGLRGLAGLGLCATLRDALDALLRAEDARQARFDEEEEAAVEAGGEGSGPERGYFPSPRRQPSPGRPLRRSPSRSRSRPRDRHLGI